MRLGLAVPAELWTNARMLVLESSYWPTPEFGAPVPQQSQKSDLLASACYDRDHRVRIENGDPASQRIKCRFRRSLISESDTDKFLYA